MLSSFASQDTTTCQNNATTYRKYEHTQFHSGTASKLQNRCLTPSPSLALLLSIVLGSAGKIVSREATNRTRCKQYGAFFKDSVAPLPCPTFLGLLWLVSLPRAKNELKKKTRGATAPTRTTCCLQSQARTRQHVRTITATTYAHTNSTSTQSFTQTDCAYIHSSFFESLLKDLPKTLASHARVIMTSQIVFLRFQTLTQLRMQ